MVGRIQVVLLACTLAWANTTSAQQEHEAPEAGAARIAFERGLELLRDQRWSEAEVEFRDSLAALPRPSAQYDLAFVVFKQGRFRESIALLQPLLSDDAAQTDPRYREAASTLLSEAVARLDATEEQKPVEPRPPLAVSTRPSLDAVRGDRAQAPAAASAAQPERPWLARSAPWITTGIGGALLIASLVIGSVAGDADDEFSQACPTHRNCDPGLKSKRDFIARMGTTSDVLLASGAVVTAGGLGWVLLAGPSAQTESRRVAIAITARGEF